MIARAGILAGLLTLNGKAVELPSMFSDHGVLQQGTVVPVWGWGKPGEAIEVEFADQRVTGTADQNGEWRVELKDLEACGSGRSMIVTGSSSGKVAVRNLLVGEVWMASGQSNMHWPLGKTEQAAQDIPAADFPAIRVFITKQTTAKSPKRRVPGTWFETKPNTAPRFSAVGFYFARKLHQELEVPVGIICTAWGGRPSEAFTSREGLMTETEGRQLVEQLDAAVASHNPEAAMNPGKPMSIYNGMIHPWVGYALRGVIWYQGEANAGRAKQYETIFPQLILDWRRQWKQELPFYFAQLANFRKPSTKPGVADNWAELQNAQRLTLSLPRTGMAIINDIGMANDIHPRNKLDVGERLARWALARDYGQDGFLVSGPVFRDSAIEGSAIRIRFEHAAGLKSRDGKPLKRFEIAGKNREWHWADAEIENESVVVSSIDVPSPVAVRYAWASNPAGANLVNADGLPASLFRTDDWKLSTER